MTELPLGQCSVFLQGTVPKAWGSEVHGQRIPLLQPGADHQRGGRRGYREGEHKRDAHRLDPDEQELGPELAVQRRAGGAGPLLPPHRQRPPQVHLLEHRPRLVAVRPDLHRQELPCLKMGVSFLEGRQGTFADGRGNCMAEAAALNHVARSL